MAKILTILNNLQQRRKFLTITSGGLILIALASDYFFDNELLYNIGMVAAAVIALSFVRVRQRQARS